MSNIKRVPDEIWGHVFEGFECTLPPSQWWMDRVLVNRSHRLTLASLCLVCQQFRRCAQPLLYKNLILEGAEPDNDTAFVRAIRELALHPNLGQNTRILTAENNFGRSGNDLRVDSEQLASAIDVMDLPPRFRQFLRSSHFDAGRISPASLCLLFTPNVQSLDITVGESPLLLSWILSGNLDLEKSSFLPKKSEDVESGDDADYRFGYDDDQGVVRAYFNFGLPRLKELHLKHWSIVFTTPITDIEAAFMHPGVEIMRMVGLDWRATHIPKRRWPDFTSNIRLLELTECIMDARGIEDMFQLCPNLESLRIFLADSNRATEIQDADYEIKMDSVGVVLRKHGRNLVKLDLETAEFGGYINRAIGSLQDLDNLRHLKIAQRDLVGYSTFYPFDPAVPHLVSVLPRSLETLYLHYDRLYMALAADEYKRKGTNNEICELITSGEFPNLREVKAERYLEDSKPFEHSIDGWRSEVREEPLWKGPSTGCRRVILMVVSKI
ncbi:unnamed protein product [Clonostachys chloroleuca]|uniref:Leucine-rich repeat domain-containing protein n=1 Tax=Clonostachys chloroleuca TaxID=1926264 RepID=A0AA35PYU6_9HYPO|nr:unnamed protein product [Clonostachys chloroleuca]